MVSTEPIQTKGLGSGFIIRDDGYILTNNHVVDAADEIRVTLQSEPKPVRAELVGRDPRTDLAVLKIEKKAKAIPSQVA
ncbi:MAG: S1C family serine protease [Candidatus Obscuribacterales bacterium]|nr:S1C family serine protease [Candidatus Obscuribacterales bacterium]